jgi:hypothetical protein
MAIKTPERPNQKIVCDLVDAIRGLLEAKYGLQKSARREIVYVMHAALLIVDEATQHQSDTQRVESFRGATAMFEDLAQTYHIAPIKGV